MNPASNLNFYNMNNWYTMQAPRVGAGTPVEPVEFTPAEPINTASNFFIPSYNSPSTEGGSFGYNGPELRNKPVFHLGWA
ncbi:hypothetical protein IJ384_01565 [bacterium]|nr:hypothetical protein [bacterium]